MGDILSKIALKQIKLLKSQNLVFEDEVKVAEFIEQNNYYRLAKYVFVQSSSII